MSSTSPTEKAEHLEAGQEPGFLFSGPSIRYYLAHRLMAALDGLREQDLRKSDDIVSWVEFCEEAIVPDFPEFLWDNLRVKVKDGKAIVEVQRQIDGTLALTPNTTEPFNFGIRNREVLYLAPEVPLPSRGIQGAAHDVWLVLVLGNIAEFHEAKTAIVSNLAAMKQVVEEFRPFLRKIVKGDLQHRLAEHAADQALCDAFETQLGAGFGDHPSSRAATIPSRRARILRSSDG
jgi:hypothetical protein